MTLKISHPGLMTTVQDAGRFGGYSVGMPPAGALDIFAYNVGNSLVGNPEGFASLECTYLGPTVEFTRRTVFAITGADLSPKLNGEPVRSWASVEAQAGDVLSHGALESGARSYIAVAGGIDVEPVQDSRSTYGLLGVGGFEGRALMAGDEVSVGGIAAGVAGLELPAHLIPKYAPAVEIRVVVGLASYRVTPDSLEQFFETAWTVAPDSNRVGYRYQGGSLEWVPREQPRGAGSDPSNVLDMGYPVGSIQAPGGTDPIALLNDAVTLGGYATLGTIISSDISVAGQGKPGDTARFVAVSLDQALRARADAKARLQTARMAINS